MEGLADDFGNSIAFSDVQRIENRIEQIEHEHENYEDWDADRSGNYDLWRVTIAVDTRASQL